MNKQTQITKKEKVEPRFDSIVFQDKETINWKDLKQKVENNEN